MEATANSKRTHITCKRRLGQKQRRPTKRDTNRSRRELENNTINPQIRTVEAKLQPKFEVQTPDSPSNPGSRQRQPHAKPTRLKTKYRVDSKTKDKLTQ
ncbi:hypothetical protein Bca52824_017539 [Brassica carinata]|uniref:Uncharacterized protein n=1 Tax=Brassica carinata TaxID=52824 RepID=A0A8X7VNK3_BRACI|nr:hypothetical protein Bca52824_017539 [Brassica carinata]